MGIIKRGAFANIVRDYVYDQTNPTNGNVAGIDVTHVMDAVNKIRNGTTTSPGSVRRTLNNLVAEGSLIYDDGVRPAEYKWNPTQPQPGDYQNRVVPTPTRGNAVTTPTTDEEKRKMLRDKIKSRMHEITGEKMEAAEEEVVKPKRNPRKGITRVNGQVYQPRDLAGRSDVEALQLLREKSIYALLSGPPGTGKTVLVDTAFGAGAGGLHTVTGNENTNVDDFLGQWSPTGDRENPYVWVDGPLITAMKQGGVLFIDDATLINPKVNAVAYPAMDGRNEVIVTGHVVQRDDGTMGPEIVKAQPGFYVVAAHNPGVHGAILTDALASRFVAQIWVETDLVLAASLGVTDRAIKLVKALRVDRDKGQANIWVPQLRELLAFRDMADVFDEMVAAANLLGQTPEDDREWMAEKMRVIFGKEITPWEVGSQL
jgi:nitric oxide reductase NorQ protein